MNTKLDGYIDTIQLPNGKVYGLQCRIVEVYPVCPKCGGSFELKYGSGKCPYCCDTYFTTEFKLQEVKQ